MGEIVTEDWFRLDNAAKIYPASHSEASPEVFRVSLTLSSPIRIAALKAALRGLIHRCPYYQVRLKRGLFWYFLQRHNEVPRIHLLSEAPISSISIRGEHLLRIQARERTVAVDFSHILTDGYGAMRFLVSLVAEYLRQRGESVPDTQFLLSPGEPADSGEVEDAYRRAFRKGTPKPENLEPAYHLPGVPRFNHYRTITGRMDLKPALTLAKSRGVTLTVYLSALYMYSLIRIHTRQAEGMLRPRRSIVRLEVPVNMRRFYPSDTMRNFSLFVSPEIDLRLGTYSFDDVLQQVHHSLQIQLDPKQLARQISRNVGGEMNPLVRVVPLVLKDLYLSFLHYRLGDSLYSGVLSNLGPFLVTDEMKPFVESVGFTLGPNPTMKKSCTVVSYDDTLHVSFGSVIPSRELERFFFKTLSTNGLRIVVSESSG
jgi:hypothetical protein